LTPYELSKWFHREISATAPRLSAALNRALIDIGEGSRLVGLGPGKHMDDPVSFQETETISVPGSDPFEILGQLTRALQKLDEHSSWNVLVDVKPIREPDRLELLYTLFRGKPA
jgi:hypothetical protein